MVTDGPDVSALLRKRRYVRLIMLKQSVVRFYAWLIAGIALAMPASAAPAPLHAFEFRNTLEDSGSAGVDILAEGGSVGPEYFEFNPMYPGDYIEGLTLKNTALTDPGIYSIEMRVKYDRLRNETPPGSYGPDQAWIKTIDYTDSLESYGLFVEDDIRWEGPGLTGKIEFVASKPTPPFFYYPGISPDSVITADTFFHAVVTRDAAGLFSCYIDGVEVFSFLDTQNDAVVDAPMRTLRFFQPDEQAILEYNVYEVTKGAIDYLRIYDQALSAAEVSDLFEPILVGDYNDDTVVDAADYVAWRDLQGTMMDLPNDPAGGQIGSAQYTNWRSNFGAVRSQQLSTSVPEPSASILLAILLVCGSHRAKRLHTQQFAR